MSAPVSTGRTCGQGLAGRAQHQPRRRPQRGQQRLGSAVLPGLGRAERDEDLPDAAAAAPARRADEIEEAFERDLDGGAHVPR